MSGERAEIAAEALALAEERGLGWRFLAGTGETGLITPEDVMAYEAEVAAKGVTPAARALAAMRQVDLRAVEPTGPGGRVSEDDVRAALAPETEPELNSYTLAVRVVFGHHMPGDVVALLRSAASGALSELKAGETLLVARVETQGVELVSARPRKRRGVCLVTNPVTREVVALPDGEMAVRPTVRVAGCFDGRMTSLATAEAFMARVKSAMEKQASSL